MITAKELKPQIISELIYHKGYHCAFTEFNMHFGIADIFAMTKAEFTHEIEIKTERGDLKSELDCILLVMSNKDQKKWMNKLHKHYAYLSKIQVSKYSLFEPSIDKNYYRDVEVDHIPNKFSFAVPGELLDYAKGVLKDTPYGLILVDRGFFKVVKTAGYLHKEKISERMRMYLLRKASMEVHIARSNVLSLEKSLYYAKK